MRFHWEVDSKKVGKNNDWAFYAKGGDFRRWFGNIDLVVLTTIGAMQYYKNNSTSNCLAERYWFTEGITYSAITSKGTGFRYYPAIGAFDKGGATICYVKELEYVLALLNTVIAKYTFDIMNPTINLQVKDVKALPVIIDDNYKETVNELVQENIDLSKADWDSFETSWDFEGHPLI